MLLFELTRLLLWESRLTHLFPEFRGCRTGSKGLTVGPSFLPVDRFVIRQEGRRMKEEEKQIQRVSQGRDFKNKTYRRVGDNKGK